MLEDRGECSDADPFALEVFGTVRDPMSCTFLCEL